MNIDFLDIVKHHGKDNICFDYLKLAGTYPSGWTRYHLEGINIMEVWHNQEESNIRLKANFPYYWAGHNFHFKRSDFIDSIQHASELLNSNLFDAEVKAFEFGSIIEIDKKPKEFFQNHIKYKNQLLVTFKNYSGKGFEDRVLKFKMYDAGKNIKSKLSKEQRSHLKENFGYNEAKHYIKIESHYKKPQVQFKQRTIYLNEVLSDSFLQDCKEDLISTYKDIMKTGIIKLPESKKDLNTGIITLLVLKELESLFNFNAEELLKHRLASIPETMLNKYDKKARKRQIEANLKKLLSSGQSEYDITSKLEAKEID